MMRVTLLSIGTGLCGCVRRFKMKRLEIKSEAFLRNYISAHGAEVKYDDDDYMAPVNSPDGKGNVINAMREYMGGYNVLYRLRDTVYECYGYNWPLWMCEEVEINYEG